MEKVSFLKTMDRENISPEDMVVEFYTQVVSNIFICMHTRRK